MECMMNRKNFARSAIAAAVIATFAGAYAHYGVHYDLSGMSNADAAVTAPSANVAPPTTTTPALTVPLGGKSATDFSGIVERYGPAVVNISVTGKMHESPTAYQSGPD